MRKLKKVANDLSMLPYWDGNKIKFKEDVGIHTPLSGAEVNYLIRRDLPPPNILEAFQDILERMKPNANATGCRPILLTGERGTGKTSAVYTAAMLSDGKPPLSFDCGNRSLDDLLVEPVFNDQTEALSHTIQDRFNGKALPPLSPLSKRMLIETLSKDSMPKGVLTQDEEGGYELDFSKVGGQPAVNAALNVIEQVAKNEQLEVGSKLGITFKEGIFIRAAKEGRRLIIDELDKAIENTGTSMQQVLAAISGLGQPYTFKKQGIEYTFAVDTLADGFTPIYTANNASDGAEVNRLKESTADRLEVVNIGPSSPEDIAIRIGQTLLGFNFLALEGSGNNEKVIADNFTKLAELNSVIFDEERKLLLRNWKKTVQACRQLGKFYHQWNELIKPGNQEVNDIDLENNRATGAVQPQGVRSAQSDLKAAKNYKAQTFSDPNDPSKGMTSSTDPWENLINQDPDEIAQLLAQENQVKLGLGERIEAIVMKRIRQFSSGPETKKMIIELAKANGILPEFDEESNKNPDITLVRDLLNTSSPEIEIQEGTEKLQKSLVDLLKKRYPELKNVENDKVISIAQLQLDINEVVQKAKDSEEPDKSYIIGLNPRYATGKGESPLTTVTILEAGNENHNPTIQENFRDCLLGYEEFCDIISHPGIRESLIQSMWTDQLIETLKENNVSPEDDEQLSAFTGTSREIRVAKILTKTPENELTTILIFDSVKKGKTILFNPKLKKQKESNQPTIILNNVDELLETLSKEWGIDESKVSEVLQHIKDPIRVTSPVAGTLTKAKEGGTSLSVGDSIRTDQTVAQIDGTPVVCPESGRVEFIESDLITKSEPVKKGAIIATINGRDIKAPCDGLISWAGAGELDSHAQVVEGQVIAEVDGEYIRSPINGSIDVITDKTTVNKDDLVANVHREDIEIKDIIQDITGPRKNYRLTKVPLLLPTDKIPKSNVKHQGGQNSLKTPDKNQKSGHRGYKKPYGKGSKAKTTASPTI